MKLFGSFILLLFFCSTSFAQEEKEKVERSKIEFGGVYKNTVSLNIGGTSGIAGISLERMLTKNLLIDLGVGYLGGGIGFKIYPWAVKRSALRPQMSVSSTYMVWPNSSNFQSNYIGLGFTYFSIFKLNFHLDIGPSYFYHYANSPKEFPDRWFLMGNAKIGYRFSFYSMKRRKSNLQNIK